MAATSLQLAAPLSRMVRSSPTPQVDCVSPMLSVLLSISVVLIAVASSPVLLHWFLLPLLLCGVLIGTDLVDWLRGTVDLFDARGIVGVLGFHCFLIAPLLMVATNYRMHYLPEQPDDYRNSLGAMALLDVLGLLVYRGLVARRFRAAPRAPTRWRFNVSRFRVVWCACVVASLAAEAWMLIRFGGLSGYLNAYTSWLAGGSDSFEGAALLFAVSESLPILLILGFAVWAHRRRPSAFLIVTVFAAFAILNFCIGGLRGSRSNVIWMMFWGAGMLHVFVRRIPRVFAFGSMFLLYGFVSIYATYKQHGAHFADEYATSGEYSTLNKGAEDLPTVLVGDFSRADVQANLLWKMERTGVNSAWGGSYLGAISLLIPKSVWPGRPPTLVRWTTDAEYGSGAYAAGYMRSTRVYGLTGEAMLNFGLLGVPLSFAALAWIVRAIRQFRFSLHGSDPRLLLLPFLVNLILILILDDSDNAFFYLFKYGLIPVLLIFCSSSLIPWRPHHANARTHANAQ